MSVIAKERPQKQSLGKCLPNHKRKPSLVITLTIESRGEDKAMSHHYSGPNWGFPHGDARLDLTDL